MFSSLLVAFCAIAEVTPDSKSDFDTLQAVTVVADRGVVVSKTDTVNLAGTIEITDALQKLPGLFVNDCGASAGLKSVSLRGFGSSHTAIYLDGVRVGNVQTGQNDLGMLDIGNLETVVVDYAQNSLSFTTARPVFDGGPVVGKFKFRAGSFSTWEPSARMDFRLSDKVSLTASGSGVISRGDFPYADNLRRANNDIRHLRGGVDVRGRLNAGRWHVKAYYNDSDRGVPGSTDWPSTDRQKDRNALVQGVLNNRFSGLYTLDMSAKASYDKMAYLSEWGNDDYGQSEFQLNSSHRFWLNEWLNASVTANVVWDNLRSNLFEASRFSTAAAMSATLRFSRFKADVALMYDGVFDRTKCHNTLSPSVDLRWMLTEGLDIVAFGRRAYRTPQFNELYYPGFGNPELKPEDAWLTDAGVEYHCSFRPGWRFNVKLDGFYNYLSNKIISSPTPYDPGIWLPYNIGVVRISGLDVRSGMDFSGREWTAGIMAAYSLQDALDKTPDSATYGSQIPFIARHSLTLSADGSFRGWKASAVWNLRDGRYDGTGAMPSWNTLDIILDKDFKLPGRLTVTAGITARNLTDCRYELSSGFPMPGRSFCGELGLKF